MGESALAEDKEVAPPGLLEYPCRGASWHHVFEPERDKGGIYAGEGAAVVTGNWLHTEGLTKKVHILKLEGVRFLAFREEHMETEKVRLNPECRRRIEDIDVNSYISIYAEKERQKKKHRYKCMCVEIQNYCRCKCVYACICTHIP